MEYRRKLLDAMEGIICTVKEKGNFTEISYQAQIGQVVTFLRNLRQSKRILYFIGNGGSAAIAIHMTADFFSNGKIRTHGMHDSALMTCLANDFGYEQVFAKQLEQMASSGDVLVAISSSGQSLNILQAVKTAQEKNCQVITLSGFSQHNILRSMGRWNFYVPCNEYGPVETLHNMILQEIVDKLK